jgi:tetraacyldisaccharide 4'-kinase
VIAGRNRHACGEKALELGAQLLVLDDGFQHLQLYRNYDIVVVDAVDPWSGLLREPQQSLEKADLIAVTQADQLSTEALEQFHQELASWSAAPVVSFYLDQPQAFNASNEPIPLEGKRVAAACGIGKPQRFVETLERAGAEVVDLLTWRDHEHPNPKALHRFAEAHKNADLLLCTEKDWVRFQSGSLRPPSMGYLRIDLAVFSGTDRWNQALSKIIALVP